MKIETCPICRKSPSITVIHNEWSADCDCEFSVLVEHLAAEEEFIDLLQVRYDKESAKRQWNDRVNYYYDLLVD